VSVVTPDDGAPDLSPHETVMVNRLREGLGRLGEPRDGDVLPDGRFTLDYLRRLTNTILDGDAERVAVENPDEDDWANAVWTPARGELRRRGVLRLSGKLLSTGLDPALVVAYAHVYNDARCVPPLPDREVDELARWVIAREAERAA
jgi:hypothetical protein